MTWWLWTLVGMVILAAQLATTVAVCRAAAIDDERTLRAQRRRFAELESARRFD